MTTEKTQLKTPLPHAQSHISARFERIRSLPKPLQEYIWSGQVEKAYQNVVSKQQIAKGRLVGITSKLVGQVLIGELHPNSFIKSLAEQGSIDLERARTIARAVSAQVFSPVRNELLSVYEISGDKKPPTAPKQKTDPPQPHATATTKPATPQPPKVPTTPTVHAPVPASPPPPIIKAPPPIAPKVAPSPHAQPSAPVPPKTPIHKAADVQLGKPTAPTQKKMTPSTVSQKAITPHAKPPTTPKIPKPEHTKTESPAPKEPEHKPEEKAQHQPKPQEPPKEEVRVIERIIERVVERPTPDASGGAAAPIPHVIIQPVQPIVIAPEQPTAQQTPQQTPKKKPGGKPASKHTSPKAPKQIAETPKTTPPVARGGPPTPIVQYVQSSGSAPESIEGGAVENARVINTPPTIIIEQQSPEKIKADAQSLGRVAMYGSVKEAAEKLRESDLSPETTNELSDPKSGTIGKKQQTIEPEQAFPAQPDLQQYDAAPERHGPVLSPKELLAAEEVVAREDSKERRGVWPFRRKRKEMPQKTTTHHKLLPKKPSAQKAAPKAESPLNSNTLNLRKKP